MMFVISKTKNDSFLVVLSIMIMLYNTTENISSNSNIYLDIYKEWIEGYILDI